MKTNKIFAMGRKGPPVFSVTNDKEVLGKWS